MRVALRRVNEPADEEQMLHAAASAAAAHSAVHRLAQTDERAAVSSAHSCHVKHSQCQCKEAPHH